MCAGPLLLNNMTMFGDSQLDEKERIRYIEYFQQQLVREGTEEFLEGQKRWFHANREALAAKYEALGQVPDGQIYGLENLIRTHQDATEFDSFFSQQIFSPLLSKALAVSAQLGFPLQFPVTFANSPAVEPSAAGVPSTESHMLFIGQGTSSFCNYWSKVFSAVAFRSGQLAPHERTPTNISEALREDPILVQATKLALRYAMSDSLVGFGELIQDENHLNFRIQLVTSMEVFVVGHELAHFTFHERHPESIGLPPGMACRDLEMHCDAMGLAICSAYGVKEVNQLALRFIGPLWFFYALHLCEETQTILLNQPPRVSATHPTIKERIRFIFDFANLANMDPSVRQSMEEALELAIIVGVHVKTVARAIRDDISKADLHA